MRLAKCLLVVLTLAWPAPQSKAPARARKGADVEGRIDALLTRMTLEEKVGQLAQYSAPFETDPKVQRSKEDEYKALIRRGQVGSLYNYTGAAKVNELQRVAVEESRLKIPIVFAHDVIHGYRTTFPIPLAEASTWDPDLVERAAAASAREATAAGLRWTFGPMMDIARDPRWGRIAEGSGEDPYLGARMAAARVRGFQGDDYSAPDRMVACPKHYVGYGAAEGGRDYNRTEISEHTLRTVYLPPFRAAVEAGAGTIMSAFNDLNGVPASANPFTLRQVLRREWGFDGVVLSDWEAVSELVNHGAAADRADAVREAITAGVDMDMVSGTYAKHLPQLVKAGKVPERLVDEAVRRVLRVKFRLGLFERPYADASREASATLTPEHLRLALEDARKSIVLLRNEKGLLPLDKGLKSIAVIGPLADERKAPLGPWSASGRAEEVVTVLQGLKTRLPGAEILYAKGTDIEGDDGKGIAEAVAAARRAGLALLVVGESAEMSGEAGSRAYLDLPGRQKELVRAVAETGVPVVLVLMNGRPLTISWESAHVPAIVEAWFLGTQTGNAVADVLLGDYNPSGKLPVTFPRTVGQVPIYYNHTNTGRPPTPNNKYSSKYVDEQYTPLYPFGFGLSYTTFRYTNLALGAKSIRADGRIEVSAEVENTGRVAGDEVVQLYVRDLAASVTRPVRELKGFRRVTLAPGERRRVQFTLTPAELGSYDRQMRFVVEPGAFKVWVGPSSAEGLEGDFEVVR